MAGEGRGGEGLYLKASEVGTYLFCKRAWRFERQGAPSSRGPERVAGTAYHERHGEMAVLAERAGGLARWCLVLAVVLALLGLAGLLG